MTKREAEQKFEELVNRKTRRAMEARIPGFIDDLDDAYSDFSLRIVPGNKWSHRHFDGIFYRTEPRDEDFPSLSAVFVRDANGNTDTESGNPGDLGGGETDLHLIYEGMSRIDADGVMAGANTVRGSGTVFGIWHPELIPLRRLFSSSLYPAQIVVTESGNIDMETELMFNLSETPIYVITTDRGASNLPKINYCGQVRIISTGASINYYVALKMLKSFGINKISVVGGRTTVSELFDKGLISDLYLTTSNLKIGKPSTPFYVGKKGQPEMKLVIRKRGKGVEEGIVFEHFSIKNESR